MSEVNEQRPMNNDLGCHFKVSQQIFINIANKKPRGQPSDAGFSLEWQKELFS